MRLAVFTVAVCLVALVAGLPFAPGSRGDDQRYLRAHRAAVKERRRADDLQRRLTRRVLQVRSLRRALLHRASSLEALRLAAVAYRVDYRLLYRIAACESTGGAGLNAYAKNRSSTAAGLGQFLDGTWASTDYASFSVYSPYANALAMGAEVRAGHAGWQWAASRGCWG